MQLPASISLTRNAQYCFSCYHEGIERFLEDGKTFYRCLACGCVNPRSIVIDEAVNWWVDENQTYWHESVGVVIKNKEDKIFCILRQIYPFAYALPAGHVDRGEDPAVGARREVGEEIGVDLQSLSLIEKLPIHGDECRRGCDDHLWHVYLSTVGDDFSPKLSSDEAASYAWLSKDEILARNDVVLPLKYIVERLGRSF